MLKEMKYVFAVYEEASFSRAARKLYVSQPALSAMVKKAEKDWNIEIFDRTTNPISLTEDGKYYIKTAKKILCLTEEMQRHFQDRSSGLSGNLIFGGSAFFCTSLFSGIVKEFQKVYPAVEVRWQERRNTELIELLTRGKIDIAFEVDRLEGDNISSLAIGREELVLAVPSDLPVNEKLRDYSYRPGDSTSAYDSIFEAPGISISHFSKEQFIFMCEGNDTHTRARQICKNGGFPPQIVLTVDSMMTSYHLAMSGAGIAFVRDSLIQNEKSDRVCFYRLDDALSQRDIMLYYRMGESDKSPVSKFISFIQEIPGG